MIEGELGREGEGILDGVGRCGEVSGRVGCGEAENLHKDKDFVPEKNKKEKKKGGEKQAGK